MANCRRKVTLRTIEAAPRPPFHITSDTADIHHAFCCEFPLQHTLSSLWVRGRVIPAWGPPLKIEFGKRNELLNRMRGRGHARPYQAMVSDRHGSSWYFGWEDTKRRGKTPIVAAGERESASQHRGSRRGCAGNMWESRLFSVWSGFDLAAWILLAAVIDLLMGDPLWHYHPVRLIGRLSMGLERLIRRNSWPRWGLRAAGALLTLFVIGLVLALVSALLWVASDISVWLFRLMVVLWTYWGLAIRGLTDAALLVYRPLVTNKSEEARQWLQYIVSRDTTHLSREDMIRATIETVAGNTCDAVIGPLFYTFLGGPAWLWAYKAVNTVDSMIGQHSGHQEDFGWFAAHLDEWANYIPARLSGLAISVAASMEGRFRQAYHAMKADGRRHPMPNTGISEAAMAGAIGVSLGGPNVYDRVVALRPTLGTSERPLHPTAIIHAIAVSWRAILVTAITFGVLAVIMTGRWL